MGTKSDIVLLIFVTCSVKGQLRQDTCRNVTYNVASLTQNMCCKNNSCPGKAVEDLKSQMAVFQGQLKDLQSTVNKSLGLSGCSIDLQSFGAEDVGWTNGLRGHIIIKRADQPLSSFVRIPSDSPAVRGIFLVTLWKCEVIHSAMFDTYAYPDASKTLDSYLRSIKPGSVLAGICVDECVYNLTPANTALKSIGIRFQGVGSDHTDANWYRSSVAFIAKKGRPADTQMVQLPRKQGPAKLRHVLQE